MATTTYEATVGVLCIQGAFFEHISHLKKVAGARKSDFFLHVVEVRKPEQLAELDGLIIPGGESTTLSVFMQKDGFLEALKQWSSRTNPPTVTWGTCAGLIMISDDLSGKKQGGQTTVGNCTRLYCHIKCCTSCRLVVFLLKLQEINSADSTTVSKHQLKFTSLY